jgi:carboxylesterase type B
MNILPRNSKLKQLPVLIFVHGGYWNSGRKGTYDLLGRNFARKGVVVVIRIIPNTDYNGYQTNCCCNSMD